MKIMSILALILSACALGAVFYKSGDQNGSNVKLGFVRSGVLLEKVEIAAEARKKLQEEQEEVKNNVGQLEKDLSDGHEKFMAEQASLNEEERKERIRTLAMKEEELNRYSNNALKKLNALEVERMQPVLQIINTRIATYARNEGFTLIWGTLTEGNILYGEKAVDITEDVIAYINEQK